MTEVSIVVPVYNVEKYLNRCISSILDSTFTDFELILIDDGSLDKSPQICDEWKERDLRIRVVHQMNMGLSAARNVGIRVAVGRFIMFIDSDDWIANNMIENLVYLIKYYDADISMCNMKRIAEPADFTNSKCEEKIKIYAKDDFLQIMFRVRGNRCVHYACGKLYKRKLLRRDAHYPVGILNEDVEGTFKAVLNATKIVETNLVGYFYFCNADSITGKKFGNNFLSLTTVWERMEKIAAIEAPQYLNYIIYNKRRTSFTILCDMILYGDEETDKKYENEKNILLETLKKDLLYLLGSPMQFPRKILMIFICYQYKLMKKCIRFFR